MLLVTGLSCCCLLLELLLLAACSCCFVFAFARAYMGPSWSYFVLVWRMGNVLHVLQNLIHCCMCEVFKRITYSWYNRPNRNWRRMSLVLWSPMWIQFCQKNVESSVKDALNKNYLSCNAAQMSSKEFVSKRWQNGLRDSCTSFLHYSRHSHAPQWRWPVKGRSTRLRGTVPSIAL